MDTTYTTWLVSAVRSDGMDCQGTVEATDATTAMKECKKIFRKIIVKGPIRCAVHNESFCYEHYREVFTFYNHNVTRN